MGAGEENERSNIAVFDLNTAKEPFVDDRSVRLRVSDTGVRGQIYRRGKVIECFISKHCFVIILAFCYGCPP